MDGKLTPVINLRDRRMLHFKMEGIQSAIDILQESDWFTRINLKDVYFAVPIHNDHQRFL